MRHKTDKTFWSLSWLPVVHFSFTSTMLVLSLVIVHMFFYVCLIHFFGYGPLLDCMGVRRIFPGRPLRDFSKIFQGRTKSGEI